MGEPLDNEALIKNSVLVTLVGTPSKLPAYHQMCATMSWLAVKFLFVIIWSGDESRKRDTFELPTGNESRNDTIEHLTGSNWPGNESRNIAIAYLTGN